MSLDISDTLGDSLYRTFSRNGLVILAGVYIAGLLGNIGWSSLFADDMERFFEDVVADFPEFEDLFDPDALVPLALDIPDGVSLLLIAVSILASIVLLAVAIRVFHAGLDDAVPTELVVDNIAWVGVNLFVGGIVFTVLWVAGLVVFIVPGIVVYVLLIYFLAAIAVEDRNFIDAFARSVAVTRGQRLQVFLLFLATFLIAIAVAFAFGIVSSILFFISPPLAELVDQFGQSLVMVYFAAVVAVSYRALTAADGPDADAPDEGDPFEEFTPASEGTHW